jgi:6-phosphogluconolactonase
MPKLHIYKSEKETCYAFAEWLADLIKETLDKQDMFTISLSAGDLPKLFFKILSTDFVNRIDWSRIHIFWGNENFISFSDQKNNSSSPVKMLCDGLPVVKEQFHVIRTDVSPEESSKQYEELLHQYFEDKQKSFDLVILGMGEQGEFLSLLSSPEESIHRDEWVIPVYDKQEDLFKVTLTIEAINAASVKAFLVTGKKKEDIVQRVLKGKYEPEKYPAQLIGAATQPIHWFLDEGAATRLIKPNT